jgi:hypothetical protein
MSATCHTSVVVVVVKNQHKDFDLKVSSHRNQELLLLDPGFQTALSLMIMV